jgi:hypothetical protein
MKTAWKRLHRTCLPFVTRSLRGNRLRRTLALSLLLGLVSILTGAWLAFGHGSLERDMRTSFGLETSDWERSRTEHVLVVHDDFSLTELRRQRDAVMRRGVSALPEWGALTQSMREGAATVEAAVLAPAPSRHLALQDEARALLDGGGDLLLAEAGWQRTFDWHSPREVALLEDIVATELVPRVERYRSPLGLAGAITLIGLVSGGVLIFGLLVVGPLMVATQIAQEVHENTLQPLTGTALGPRGLVVGLGAGPFAVLGLLLVPQAFLLLGASLLTGHAIAAVGTLVAGLVGSVLLATTCALAGLAMGRKQSPGLVGVALLALLVIPFLIGLGLGMGLEPDTLGVLTIMPQAGAVHLLREALAPAGRLEFGDAIAAHARLVVGLAAFVTWTAVGGLALERRVASRTGPTLRRHEAFLAAGTLVVASILAMPQGRGFDEAQVLAALALVTLPFMLLVMGRVHVGLQEDAPDTASRRRRNLLCLAEFGGFVGLHALVSVLVGGLSALDGFGPAALFNVTWALAVAALVAIRSVTVPTRLPGMLYLTFCLLMAVMAYVTGCIFACDGPSGDPWFALWHLSPVLGIAQLVMTGVIPWTLLRAPRHA